jgi:drug/metabolite transporter (DMT)-like permease
LKKSNSLIKKRPQTLQAFGNNSAIFQLMAGAGIISFSGVWVKLAHVTPTMTGFYRVFFGGIFLLAATAWKREFRWIGWRPLVLAFVCGFFLALDLFLWHTSIQYIGPGLATLLGNFEVFFLAAAGVMFMGEKVGLRFFFSIIMALVGLVLIVGLQWDQLGQSYKTGIFLGLSTAVVYTGFLLALRKLQSDQDQIGGSVFHVLMLVSWTTAVYLGLKAFLTGDSFIIPDGQSWIVLLVLGLLSQAIGWILITNALPRVRASLVGLILLLQPSLSFVWYVLFFQRETSVINWLGVIVVLCAIYLGMRKDPARDG